MGETTEISWTDHTFNPWIGCTNVSAACDHCYAETLAKRYGWAKWGEGEDRKQTSDANWRKPLSWDRTAARDGVRRRVFCASLADVFDAEVPNDWRVELMMLILNTQHLDWLLLTKRPQVAKKFFIGRAMPSNVWLGTTVEDQKMADLRVPILLSIPRVSVRFLSCEPLLGRISLRQDWYCWNERIGWVIAGGESGIGARPTHPDWLRSLRDQCLLPGIPFHMKQWGEWIDHDQRGVDMLGTARSPLHDWGDGHTSVRIGKNAAGATLDGREWREFPAADAERRRMGGGA